MEMKSMKKHFLVFLIVLSLATFESAKAAELKKWHIHIANGLSKGQILLVHCKSKDDDLGEHNISVGAEFDWTFRVNFWNTTLFWCYLRKPNGQAVSFEAFWIESRSNWLYDKCFDSNCVWIAKDDGVYMKDNTAQTDVFIHQWK